MCICKNIRWSLLSVNFCSEGLGASRLSVTVGTVTIGVNLGKHTAKWGKRRRSTAAQVDLVPTHCGVSDE